MSQQVEKIRNNSEERPDYFDLQRRKDQLGLTGRALTKKNLRSNETGKFLLTSDLIREKSRNAAEKPILRKTKTQIEFPELKALAREKAERELKEAQEKEA